jgi:hypothetical protein
MSLEQSDAEAAAHAVAPRVSLADIEDSILEQHYLQGPAISFVPMRSNHPLFSLTICVLVLKNGFTIVGKSAPASPANFNAELGRKLAYEDCVRQIWPLMGFALREKLAGF